MRLPGPLTDVRVAILILHPSVSKPFYAPYSFFVHLLSFETSSSCDVSQASLHATVPLCPRNSRVTDVCATLAHCSLTLRFHPGMTDALALTKHFLQFMQTYFAQQKYS